MHVVALSTAAIVTKKHVAAVLAVQAEGLFFSGLASDAFGIALLQIPNVSNVKVLRGELYVLGMRSASSTPGNSATLAAALSRLAADASPRAKGATDLAIAEASCAACAASVQETANGTVAVGAAVSFAGLTTFPPASSSGFLPLIRVRPCICVSWHLRCSFWCCRAWGGKTRPVRRDLYASR